MNRLLGGLLLLVLATPARGHDYWLAPETYRPRVGQDVPVRLFIGDHFVSGIERQLRKKMTVRFRLIDSAGTTRDLLKIGTDRQKPVTRFALPAKGTWLLAMQRDWAVIELEAEKFHKYLEHEGLQRIIDARRKAGEADKPARERYRRYLKSLLVAGNQSTSTWKRKLGHRLEILPLSDPSLVKPGETLSVRVLFDARPLAAAQVTAFGRRAKKVTERSSRTDATGTARLKLDHPGEWVVRLVHMRRCPDRKAADWESFWGAVTFGFSGQ